VSMGYFINPLVSMLLGVVILRERLQPWQAISVLFAFAGVLYLGISLRALPWIALSLAFSFGLYGLLRKTVAVESLPGTFVESTLVLPAFVGYLVFVTATGRGAFGAASPATHLLLVLSGPVSAVPLLMFAAGARRIPLSMVGFLQYIAPTGHLLLGVLAFGEPFTVSHLISFALIWTGVLMYAVSTAVAFRAGAADHPVAPG
jgi:chloramphenicol-sensitive protein RarD